MLDDDIAKAGPPARRSQGGFGRVAAVTLKPFTGAASAAVGVGMDLQRRTVERVLDSPDLDHLVSSALENRAVQAAIKRALESDGAKHLIATFFDSGLFDVIVDRLLASEALWRLIDEVAASPAVMAAVGQQGLGFADQLGDAVRARSRRADHRLEHVAGRLSRRRHRADGDGEAPDSPGP
jgi:hypothetical protein